MRTLGWRKPTMMLCGVLAWLFAALPVRAPAQMSGAPIRDQVFGRAELVLTSATAGTKWVHRYSDPIYVGSAQHVFFPYTLASCNNTSKVSVGIQWIEEDFNAPSATARAWNTGTDGYPLTTGWSVIDSATTHTRSTTGDFITSSPVKSRYCRLAFGANVRTDGDNTADPTITAYVYRKYTPRQTIEVGSKRLVGITRITGTPTIDAIAVNGSFTVYDNILGADWVITTATAAGTAHIGTTQIDTMNTTGGTVGASGLTVNGAFTGKSTGAFNGNLTVYDNLLGADWVITTATAAGTLHATSTQIDTMNTTSAVVGASGLTVNGAFTGKSTGAFNGNLSVYDNLVGPDWIYTTASVIGTAHMGSTQIDNNRSTNSWIGTAYVTGAVHAGSTQINTVYTTAAVVGSGSMWVNSSSTLVFSALGGMLAFTPDDGTVWTRGYGYVNPTTGGVRLTTFTIPLELGTIVDKVGVRYQQTEAIGAVDMRITALRQTGATLTLLDNETSGAADTYKTLWTSNLNYTVTDNQSLVVVLGGADDDVRISMLFVCVDRRRFGNP